MVCQSVWPVGLDCCVSVRVDWVVVLVDDDYIRDTIVVDIRHVIQNGRSINIELLECPSTIRIRMIVLLDQTLSTLWRDEAVHALHVLLSSDSVSIIGVR